MTTMTKQEANAKVAELLKEASNAITAAEKLADEHGLEFSSPIHQYGMGGNYVGVGRYADDDEWYPSATGWQASSQSC